MPPEKKPLKTCFYICPIGSDGSDTRKRTDDVFDFVIKKALENFKSYAPPIRADQMANSGSITSQIIDLLRKADLVIADLTGKNPNVFYELAIRHAVRKPFIQIMNSNEDLPFDVADLRTIRFDEKDLRSVHKAEQALVEQIEFLEASPEKIITPISQAIEMERLEGSSSSQERLLANVMHSVDKLTAEVQKLKKSEAIAAGTYIDHVVPNYTLETALSGLSSNKSPTVITLGGLMRELKEYEEKSKKNKDD